MPIIPSVWTNSRLKAYMNCPAAEHYRYHDKLVPLSNRQPLYLGQAVHKGIETRSISAAMAILDKVTPGTQDEQDDVDVARAMCRGMLTGYFRRYPAFDNALPELRFDIPIRNEAGRSSRKHRMCGKIDCIAKEPDGNWIVEYKTAGNLTGGYFERLYIDEQITTYFYAATRLGYDPKGVIYRVIRKPSIRPKKGETMIQFADRVEGDYLERPEFYFTEERYYRTSDDLDAFERNTWRKITQHEANEKKGWIFKNTGQCVGFGTCPYLPLCIGSPGAELMYATREPNEELKDEE